MLAASPELEAKALFGWLCEHYPGHYQEGQVRTFSASGQRVAGAASAAGGRAGTIEKRFWVLKGPLQVHPLWLHKDERLVSLVLVLMIALLLYCLLEYLVRQAQRQLTGRALLEAFAGYTVVLLRFADGSQLWTFPELTALQADLLSALNFPRPQMSLMLV